VTTHAGERATIGGYRIEAVVLAGSGGTLYRASEERGERRVALFVLSPELAGDQTVRLRFTRAAELAETLQHPHALPVEAVGDADDSVFLVNPWVQGLNLAARLSRGPLSPAEALRVLVPVARALAAAHRIGLAHGDITSESVLIADGPDEVVYLDGFGSGQARRDPATPDADVAAFGQLLLETLGADTLAGDRSPAIDTDGLDDRLETIAARALARGPGLPIVSADELVLALEQARAAARAAPLEPGLRQAQESSDTGADDAVVDAAAERPEDANPTAARARRAPRIAAAVCAAVVAVALIVALATYSATSRTGAGRHVARRSTTATGQPIATVAEGHLSVAQKLSLGAPARGVAVGPSGAVWVSLPSRNEIIRLDPDGHLGSFAGIPNGGPITAGNGGAWIAQPAGDAIKVTPDGNVAERVAVSGQPVAVAPDVDGSSAWVADASGAITHIGAGDPSNPTVVAHVSPAPTGLAVGEPNWVWGVNGGFVRVSPDGSGSQTFDAGGGANAVTVNQGIWVAHGDGTVTRFDPQVGHLVATVRTPGALSGIAAREGSPYVWAISSSARSLYELSLAGPQIVGVVRFSSPPTGVAVTHLGVWVTTAGGSLVRIQR
jgi:Protein kinase domain